ncbi:hypothetical protein C5167_004631 [Papaver somniferum]|uniref:Uncharacterized protein n=1 Tax=Papaver somniferum TaxID=3469 RepID=A0A4Y7JC04_PAPSO|nr:hypothetical protein C5167_004631 [Papaver somniferum]
MHYRLNKYFWLKRQRMCDAQFELQLNCFKTRSDHLKRNMVKCSSFDSWTRHEQFPPSLTFHGVFCANALHWTSDASNYIVSFGVSNEKFMDAHLPEKEY